MLQKQIIGILNLSLPLIFIYNVWPLLFVNFYCQILCSLLIGLYIYYCSWNQLNNLEQVLQYHPTGSHKDFFEKLIKECQVDPNTINLRYAFTNESIAMAAGKTIIVDPMVWHGISDDPKAIDVYNIFIQHLQPNLSSIAQKRITETHNFLTLGAQRFIFKHELGHIVRDFSSNKLITLFLVGFFAGLSGIILTVSLLPINGFVAMCMGMLFGGFMDFFVTYLFNFVWKLNEEKAADAFAVKHSSDEDVKEAIIFFKNHQNILDQYPERGNFLANLPSVLKSGHQHGKNRSNYLLQLMLKK